MWLRASSVTNAQTVRFGCSWSTLQASRSMRLSNASERARPWPGAFSFRCARRWRACMRGSGIPTKQHARSSIAISNRRTLSYKTGRQPERTLGFGSGSSISASRAVGEPMPLLIPLSSVQGAMLHPNSLALARPMCEATCTRSVPFSIFALRARIPNSARRFRGNWTRAAFRSRLPRLLRARWLSTRMHAMRPCAIWEQLLMLPLRLLCSRFRARRDLGQAARRALFVWRSASLGTSAWPWGFSLFSWEAPLPS